MPLIKVVPHGVYATLYPALEIGASTAAEAIEGWSRQVGMSLRDNRVMDVIGFDTQDKLYADTDVTELHVVPAMYGGGGNFLKIVIGAALIAIAIWNPGIGGMILSQAGAGAVAGAGIGLVIGGITGMFLRAPTTSKESDPEASKYIGSGKMTTAIGTSIPIGGGRMMIGGQILSLQVNSSEMAIGSWPGTP